MLSYLTSVLILLIWQLTLVTPVHAAPTCNLTISGSSINGQGIAPGSTICIPSGTRGGLLIENLQGSSTKYITIINASGQTVINNSAGCGYGICVYNSRYFRITGTGSSTNQYGIKIAGAGGGIRLTNRASDFEVDHLEILNVSGTGISANTKDSCDGQTTQANFTQYNSVFHDNRIVGASNEGFYVGNNRTINSGSGQGQQQCPDGSQPLQPILIGVKIYRNYLDSTGFDSINVKGAPQNCQIYDNQVFRDSRARRTGEEGGIRMAINTQCDVYNNLVKDGNSRGIGDQGKGGNKIYNNVIVNSGQMYTGTEAKGSGISIESGAGGNGSVLVWNNTIIRPRSFGVSFARSGTGHQIKNNLVVSPGGSAVVVGSAQASNNLTLADVTAGKFVNSGTDNYALQPASPALNAGTAVPGLTFDFVYHPRPQGSQFDVGAYEDGGDAPPLSPTQPSNTSTPPPNTPTPPIKPFRLLLTNWLTSTGDRNQDHRFNALDWVLNSLP